MSDKSAEFLAGINSLPSDTKGRLMVEMSKLSSKKALRAFVQNTFGNSCGVCTRFY